MKKILSLIIATVLCLALMLSVCSCSDVNAEATVNNNQTVPITDDELRLYNHLADSMAEGRPLEVYSESDGVALPEFIVRAYRDEYREIFIYFVSENVHSRETVVCMAFDLNYEITAAKKIEMGIDAEGAMGYITESLDVLVGNSHSTATNFAGSTELDGIEDVILRTLEYTADEQFKNSIQNEFFSLLCDANGSTGEVELIHWDPYTPTDGVGGICLDKNHRSVAVYINTSGMIDSKNDSGFEAIVIFDKSGVVSRTKTLRAVFTEDEEASYSPDWYYADGFVRSFEGRSEDTFDTVENIKGCDQSCDAFKLALSNASDRAGEFAPGGFESWIYDVFGSGSDPVLVVVGLVVSTIMAIILLIAIFLPVTLVPILLFIDLVLFIIVIILIVSKSKLKKRFKKLTLEASKQNIEATEQEAEKGEDGAEGEANATEEGSIQDGDKGENA